MADVETNGKISDAQVIFNTELWKFLQNNSMNILQKSALSNIDDNSQLGEPFMKPQSNSNSQLSRTRRVVENAFEILRSKFRVLQK